MRKPVSPAEMRRRLADVLNDEKVRASEARERPAWTAASLGRALGNKDHIRDFLISRKESLGLDTILEAEQLLGLKHGALHLPASFIPSYDPDAPEVDPHDSDPAGQVHFPPDAIKELAAKAGMGAGQTIETSYTRDGKEMRQSDAVLDEYWLLPPTFIRTDLNAKVSSLLVVNCRGDSMEPTLKNGDRVIVDVSDKKPSGDTLFAIRDQLGEVFVKRLQLVGHNPVRIVVKSDNPAVSDREEAFEDVPIVGRVVAGIKLF